MIVRIFFVAVLSAVCSAQVAQARIGVYALPADYGIGQRKADWTEINPETWDVFTSFDSEEIFVGDPKEKRLTTIQTEFSTSTVIEGRKVGDATVLASISDRGSFFGGEGYMDLYGFAPFGKEYASQVFFLGGWRYDVLKYVDIDIGGNIVYSDKKISGPGFTDFGGSQWRGDIYVGLMLRELYLNPFVYGAYEPSYDACKFSAGISPTFDLKDLTTIDGLSLEVQVFYGYITANNWAADDLIDGKRWRNSYSYVNAEANLVYLYDGHIKTHVGVGWSYNNDGKYAPNGAYLSPSNAMWFTCGIGYVF